MRGGEKMDRNFSAIFPITLTPKEANQILENSVLRQLVDQFSKEILEKKPTPLEAQAVLVTTWETVLRNAKLNLPSQKSETGQFRS